MGGELTSDKGRCGAQPLSRRIKVFNDHCNGAVLHSGTSDQQN